MQRKSRRARRACRATSAWTTGRRCSSSTRRVARSSRLTCSARSWTRAGPSWPWGARGKPTYRPRCRPSCCRDSRATPRARARAEAVSRSREIGELTRIGVALGTERDLRSLLDLILTQARRITSSDAGSLYLVETSDEGQKRLRFRLAHTYSKPEAPFVEFTILVDRTSLAGYAAVTGDPLVIDDAYFLPPDVEYSINRSFDERYGYRTKSMLVIPMKDHREWVIGVLQLINRKRSFDAVLATAQDVQEEVVPFSKRTVELVTALAGQAAVAIENSQLYEEIERLFEGFVKAAVHAIEQRDPTTFGHSGRVANMTVGLAAIVD